MLSADGEVIYVGKAVKLCNRVSSYFMDMSSHTAKTRMLVSKIDDFKTIQAEGEFEALLLEASLIKRYVPKYNILLKDDKGYPYIRIDLRDEYPILEISGREEEDGALYFGPYGSRTVTFEVIRTVTQALKLPDCGRKFPRDIGKIRPCLNFQLGLCEGWCIPGEKSVSYMEMIRMAVRILDGGWKQTVGEIQKEMHAAAEELQFERAAILRDRSRSIERIGKKRLSGDRTDEDAGDFERKKEYEPVDASAQLGKMLGLAKTPIRMEAIDVSHTAGTFIVGSVVTFVHGKYLKSGNRKFKIRELSTADDYASVGQILKRRIQHYLDGDISFMPLPDLFLIDGGAAHAAAALSVLNEMKISVPVIGMVKDDRHRTRALIFPDGREVGISGTQAVFALIGQIQEKVHRSAIEYHRKLQSKALTHSALDAIPGVGKKRKEALISAFGSVEDVKNASKEDLAGVVPQNTALEIYAWLHQGEDN